MKQLILQFVAVDDWNRPVFKDGKGRYFGDTENLFNYGADKNEVYNFYRGKQLNEHICYFGRCSDGDPIGGRINEDVKIILE